jgi:atypical dual specificity phosphatase
MEAQSISENLWWAIPSKLSGVRKPTEIEMSVLQSQGIGGIVSVMDDPSNLDMYERLGIPHLWLPVKGGTAPTITQIASLQEFIEQQNSLGHGVAVHCTSGRRRTGTFLAAYLIAIGKTYEEALKIIYDAKPDVELREAQTDFLKELANSPLDL